MLSPAAQELSVAGGAETLIASSARDNVIWGAVAAAIW